MELKYIRTDRNGTQYFENWTCEHCGGAGRREEWRATGCECWACGGTGRRAKAQIVKKYTPEHEAKLAAKAAARLAAKEAEENARFFKRNAFSEDGVTYIYTGDTYAIKDDLKAHGAKFDNWYHWRSAEPIGNYPCIKATAEELCNFDGLYRLDMQKWEKWTEAHKI